MTTRVALEHRTTYAFDRPVRLSPHLVRLHPSPGCRTPVTGYALDVEPAAHDVRWVLDPVGNWSARLTFADPTERLAIGVGMVVDLVPRNPFDFVLDPSAATAPFTYDAGLAEDLAACRRPVTEPDGAAPGPEVVAFRERLPRAPAAGTPTVQLLGDLTVAVQEAVAYSVRLEEGVQSPDQTLRAGVGSCRDTAWLLVSLLRERGLAARFVSGYLVQLAADDGRPAGTGGLSGAPASGGPDHDGADLHAWAEAFLPGAGWVGLDPTSGLFAAEGHLPLAASARPEGAAPVTGTTEPAQARLDFATTVRRVHGTPTRP